MLAQQHLKHKLSDWNKLIKKKLSAEKFGTLVKNIIQNDDNNKQQCRPLHRVPMKGQCAQTVLNESEGAHYFLMAQAPTIYLYSTDLSNTF